MTLKRKIGIGLIVLQVLSVLGGIMNGSFSRWGERIYYPTDWIIDIVAYSLFGIIGIILVVTGGNRIKK